MTALRTALFAGLAALLCGGALAQGRAAAVETATVAVTEMSETISIFGEVIAARESAVATRVAGVISEVPVRVGSRVAKGDLLAGLDTERLAIDLARAETERTVAEAGLSVAEARLEQAKRAMDRSANLRRASTISDAQYLDRVSEFAQARGALAEARARLALTENAIARAQYDIDNAHVRAPFAGVVLEISAQEGQFAGSGSTVATLLDLASLEVLANVPATYAQALTPGLSVSGASDTNAALDLVLRATLPTEYSSTRTRPVLFGFAQPQETLAVGQSITLDIPVGTAREVLVVPKDALIQARGGWSAFVHRDGAAAPQQVEIGASIGNAFEVLSGLKAGDEVVVRGNERLRPGQAITVTRRDGAPVPPQSGQGAGAGDDAQARTSGAPNSLAGARDAQTSQRPANAPGDKG